MLRMTVLRDTFARRWMARRLGYAKPFSSANDAIVVRTCSVRPRAALRFNVRNMASPPISAASAHGPDDNRKRGGRHDAAGRRVGRRPNEPSFTPRRLWGLAIRISALSIVAENVPLGCAITATPRRRHRAATVL